MTELSSVEYSVAAEPPNLAKYSHPIRSIEPVIRSREPPNEGSSAAWKIITFCYVCVAWIHPRRCLFHSRWM